MPPGDQAKNYYPFLDFAWADCTVNVTLGPTHWSDNSTVRHGVLELVCTSSHDIAHTSKVTHGGSDSRLSALHLQAQEFSQCL